MSTLSRARRDGLDVAALDGAALAQVVAHHEGRAHRRAAPAPALRRPRGRPRSWRSSCSASRQRRGAARQRAAPRRASRGPGARARPHRPRRLLAPAATSGPRSSHREVQPRLLGPAVVQVVAVVDDVDAADEGHLAVDHAQLLVQAAQLRRAAARPTSGRAGGTPPARTPRARQPLRAARGSVAMRAEAVDHHAAPPRRAARRRASASATRAPAASSWKM